MTEVDNWLIKWTLSLQSYYVKQQEKKETCSDLNYIGSISCWHKVKRESLLLPEIEASLSDLHVGCRCGKTITITKSSLLDKTVKKKYCNLKKSCHTSNSNITIAYSHYKNSTPTLMCRLTINFVGNNTAGYLWSVLS